MTQILIVYASSMGNTKRMADAIADGARQIAGVHVKIRSVDEARLGEVRECDALVLGSPVRHGNADPRLRRFIEADCEPLATNGHLADKIAAVFTVGGNVGRHGDCGEIAQLSLLRAFAAAGMTIVSACTDSRGPTLERPYWGPHARLHTREGPETLQPDTLTQACQHGLRVARLASAVTGNPRPPTRKNFRLPAFFDRFHTVFR
ncbi:MAG TPA: flavodoxin family protein [Burkholderiales bacterium]|nr:flavodoxin family protein [Burkholderiales bacterium]